MEKLTSSSGLLWLLRWLSYVASAASVVSFLQAVLGVGLVPILADILEWYRRLAHPLVGALPLVFGFAVPGWYMDAATVSAASAGLFFKAVQDLSLDEPIEQGDAGRRGVVLPTLLFLVFSYSLFGVVLLVISPAVAALGPAEGRFSLSPSTSIANAEIRRGTREFVRLLALAVLSAIAFYVFNEFLQV